MTAHDASGAAATEAAERVAAVVDDPAGRLDLLRELYVSGGEDQLPYHRAADAFMRWQVRRGLLNPTTSERPGSPWWRGGSVRAWERCGGPA